MLMVCPLISLFSGVPVGGGGEEFSQLPDFTGFGNFYRGVSPVGESQNVSEASGAGSGGSGAITRKEITPIGEGWCSYLKSIFSCSSLPSQIEATPLGVEITEGVVRNQPLGEFVEVSSRVSILVEVGEVRVKPVSSHKTSSV